MWNPLQQRLHLYRFALVHIDPDRPVEATALGTPAPQYLHAGPKAWRELFKEFPPYQAMGESAVICASLKQLKRLRAQHPHRQLILVRTPFAPTPRKSELKALVRPLPEALSNLEPLLAEDDDIEPLQRQRSMPEPPFEGEARIVCPHPYRTRLEQLRRERPDSTFLVQEDGVALEQLWLFSDPVFEQDNPWRDECERYDSWFKETFAKVQGRAYIFAKDRDLLSWFRSDVVRLLGRRFHCWDYPQIPDSRDPLNHLILVHDGAIRFRMLTHPFPVYHLDGVPRDMKYRMARYPNRQPPRWRADVPPNARADFRTENRVLTFHRVEDQWLSYKENFGPHDLPMEDEEFAARLGAMDMLFGD